ncbi:hypothetical protein ACS0TY_003785 [Phlomoides rotata]
MIKLNIDVAFFSDSREMGFRMILQDCSGSLISCRSMNMHGVYSPDEGEAIGVFESFSWIKQLNFRNVLIEMDAKLVVNAFNLAHTKSLTVFVNIVEACKRISRNHHHCKV